MGLELLRLRTFEPEVSYCVIYATWCQVTESLAQMTLILLVL